jgi:hypothetical protein
MKRGLLEEFQVTAEWNPTTARRALSLGELSRDSKSMCVDMTLQESAIHSLCAAATCENEASDHVEASFPTASL